jgi:hypothetical protein
MAGGQCAQGQNGTGDDALASGRPTPHGCAENQKKTVRRCCTIGALNLLRHS